MGYNKIDKELDIGVILKKIRQFNFFMKSILTKNQINLLKLKSSKFLASTDDELDATFKETHVKVVDKKALLNNYTDLLM